MNRPVLLQERVERYGNKKEWKHLYKCYCGNTFLTFRNFVDRGHTTSCGCLKGCKTHGHAGTFTRTPTYLSWDTMLQRCTNANNNNYPYYGGRGINVYE